MTLTMIYIVIFVVVFTITYFVGEHIAKLKDTILHMDGIYVQQGDYIADLILQQEAYITLTDDLESKLRDSQQAYDMINEAFNTTRDSLNDVIEVAEEYKIRIVELELQMNHDYGLSLP